jgi:hypothetical protein
MEKSFRKKYVISQDDSKVRLIECSAAESGEGSDLFHPVLLDLSLTSLDNGIEGYP